MYHNLKDIRYTDISIYDCVYFSNGQKLALSGLGKAKHIWSFMTITARY